MEQAGADLSKLRLLKRRIKEQQTSSFVDAVEKNYGIRIIGDSKQLSTISLSDNISESVTHAVMALSKPSSQSSLLDEDVPASSKFRSSFETLETRVRIGHSLLNVNGATELRVSSDYASSSAARLPHRSQGGKDTFSNNLHIDSARFRTSPSSTNNNRNELTSNLNSSPSWGIKWTCSSCSNACIPVRSESRCLW